jgi:hypothetical protein
LSPELGKKHDFVETVFVTFFSSMTGDEIGSSRELEDMALKVIHFALKRNKPRKRKKTFLESFARLFRSTTQTGVATGCIFSYSLVSINKIFFLQLKKS